MPTSDLSQERKGLVASSYHILQDSCGLWNSLFCSLSFPSSFCAPVGDNSCLLYSSEGLILEVTVNDHLRTKETFQVLHIHTVRKVKFNSNSNGKKKYSDQEIAFSVLALTLLFLHTYLHLLKGNLTTFNVCPIEATNSSLHAIFTRECSPAHCQNTFPISF